MSGAEFVAALGVIASVVQVSDASKRIIDRIHAYRQNLAFQDVLPQLELFMNDLERFRGSLSTRTISKSEEATLKRVLDGCERKLTRLDGIIHEVRPTENVSKLRKTWMGLRSFGKDSTMRELTADLDQYRLALMFHMNSHWSITSHDRSSGDTAPSQERRYFEVPPKHVAVFVGRSSILASIRAHIAPSKDLPRTHNSQFGLPKVAVITGLGGQGKSQVALRLCHELAGEFRGIFWVNAQSEQTVLADIERYDELLAQELNNSGRHHSSFRYSLPTPSLIVLDDYGNPKEFPDIATFFPRGAANAILVTSRFTTSHRLGVGYHLDGLTTEDGLQLLLSRSPDCNHDEDVAAGKRIVSELGHLPLALDQASAYISTRPMRLETFERLLSVKRRTILAHTPIALWEYATSSKSANDPETQLSAFTTWECSFDQIDKNKPEIELFLTQMAFLEPNNLSESFLRDLCASKANANEISWSYLIGSEDDWNSTLLQDVVVELSSMSLVQRLNFTDGDMSFALHPVVKDWLQLRAARDTQLAMTRSSSVLVANLISTSETSVLEYRIRNQLLQNVDACCSNVRRFVDSAKEKEDFGLYLEGYETVFATFYADHDRITDAMALFTEILKTQKAKLGVANLVTLVTMNNVGNAELVQGKFQSAVDILRTVLEEKESILPPQHGMVLNTMVNLGSACRKVRRLDEAADLFNRVINAYHAFENIPLDLVVAAQNNLGETEFDRKNYPAAKSCFDMALANLEDRMTSRGDGTEDNTVTCRIWGNIARIHEAHAEYAEAVTLRMRAASGYLKLLGPKHARVIFAIQALGRATASYKGSRRLGGDLAAFELGCSELSHVFASKPTRDGWEDEFPQYRTPRNHLEDTSLPMFQIAPAFHHTHTLLIIGGNGETSDSMISPAKGQNVALRRFYDTGARRETS